MKPSILAKKPRTKNNGRGKGPISASYNPNKEGSFQGGYEGQENRDRSRHNGHRGNYQQQFDKYMNLARESLAAGDRVSAEFHYQHADHYLRLQNEKNKQDRDYRSTEKNTKLYPAEAQNIEKQIQIEKLESKPIEDVSVQQNKEEVV